MNAAQLLASFWQPALSGDRQAHSDASVFSSLISLSFFLSPAGFRTHAFIVPIFLQYWSRWPFLSHFSSYFPCRCLRAPSVRIFSTGMLPSSSCQWDDTIISFQTSISIFLKFRTQESRNKHAKVSGPWHLPEGLSQTINAYSANTVNSLKKINKPKVIYTLLKIFLWCREYSILFSLPIQTGSHERRWVIFKFLPCMWFTNSLHTIIDVKTLLLAFTYRLKTLASVFQYKCKRQGPGWRRFRTAESSWSRPGGLWLF